MKNMFQTEVTANQGSPGSKPWKVDASETTQPITGTVDTYNYIWNVSTLAWEAATGSLSGGNNVTVANFPASYPVTNANLDTPLSNLLQPADTLTGISLLNSVVNPVTTTQMINRTATGVIDAISETVSIDFTGHQSAAVVVSGTWSGTLVIEGSVDGSTWVTCWTSIVNQSPVALGIPTPASSITTNGIYKVFQSSGFTTYRIRASAWTSGSATITWSTVYAPASFIYTSGAIIQQVAADDNNSSVVNLAKDATFTGTAQTSLGVNSFQINICTDQNCNIYVDQSTDGINWDIIDEYNYYYTLGGNSWTVQATASYYRVRVTNVGVATTTFFRLQTCLCPIVEALPRSLSQDGNLKVEINALKDVYGFDVVNTPNNEMRVVTPYRLIGSTFTGTILDSNYWTASLGTGGTVTIVSSEATVSTGTTADNTAALQTARSARYVGGSSNRFRGIVRVPDTGIENNTRRWGAFTATDGAFFELAGTTFSVVTRKSSVDSKIENGSFNGTRIGAVMDLDTDIHTWEIYFNNSKVYFINNGDLLHTSYATTTTWSGTLTLPSRIESVNSGGLTTDVPIYVRSAIISRMGSALTQPLSKFQSGQTAGLVLKYGAGNLHLIAISGVTNNSVVTLYDNTAASGTILWSSGTMASNALPFSIDLKGLTFSTGLTLAITGANANATVIYE